jgi:hypothetical protein
MLKTISKLCAFYIICNILVITNSVYCEHKKYYKVMITLKCFSVSSKSKSPDNIQSIVKNIASASAIVCANGLIGGIAGFGGFWGLAGKSTFQYNDALGFLSLIGMPIAGAAAGALNGVKFECISRIIDHFETDHSTEIKIGTNLVIDGIVGGLICAAGGGYVGAAVFGGLAVMDGINFGIENLINHSEIENNI